MQVNRIYLIGLGLLTMASCIDPYTPEIAESQDLIVVSGNITDQPGTYTVEVSRSAPFNNPLFLPVPGCVVHLEDDQGNGVTYHERRPGVYQVDLDESFLGVGKAYKLFVFTPDGREYQSEYDTILACPPIDSIYYGIKYIGSDNPAIIIPGAQFYVDVSGQPSQAKNFLWKVVETYEYHSTHLMEYYWDGKRVTKYEPPIDSFSVCYRTHDVGQVFAASSGGLSANTLNRVPLNYVSNQTHKLKIKYSLLVRQHSLSDAAFFYWDRLLELQRQSGGLYERQPSEPSGNIYNVNNENEKVLGYFYVSQVTEKRLTLTNAFAFPILDYPCALDTAKNTGEIEGFPWYMISYSSNPRGGPPWGYGDQGCFDCRLQGGDTIVPDFW